MARSKPAASKSFSPPIIPWYFVGAGLGMIVLGALAGSPVAPLACAAGLLTLGIAVALRFRSLGEDRAQRLRSGGFVAVATAGPLIASLTLNPAWDTVILFLRFLVIVGVVGAVLACLSVPWRRAFISLLVLFHFSALFVNVLSAQPGSGHTMWLASQLWLRVYRPYLEFLHLTNAFHFFAPEPGPSFQLWFHLDYADGSGRWVKLPQRDTAVTALEFHRQLRLTDKASQTRDFLDELFPNLEDLHQQRVSGGVLRVAVPVGDVFANGWQGPLAVLPALAVPIEPIIPTPLQDFHAQYALPTVDSGHLVSAYVRHVAREHAQADGSPAWLTGIKVYRVLHRFPTPAEVANGLPLDDPTLLLAFFDGEFDAAGKLKGKFDEQGRLTTELDRRHGFFKFPSYLIGYNKAGQAAVKYRDPYLYWLIPITRDLPGEADPAPGPFPAARRTARSTAADWKGPVRNYVRLHAGDWDERDPGW
jgi:hypothetical protein